MRHISLLLCTGLNFIIGLVCAQSLPKVQQDGLRAPVGIKIDGNLSEWNNTFKADNSANRMLYSIANDDKNIYLAIRMQDHHSTYKALWGAIQFTVFKPQSTEVISLAYPHVPNRKEEITDIAFDGHQLKKVKSAESTFKIDSLFKAGNAMISVSFREIELLDAQGGLVKVLSLYNEEGIKVAGRFNSNFEYEFELAIPIKQLGIAGRVEKFKYTISLLGTLEARPGKPVNFSWKNPSILSPDTQFTGYTTSLNGEYVFIK